MTQTSPQQPPTDDPLAGLHKMSTTAGVGVGEYVAINPMAVTALVAGAASALALLDPILLVIPVVAIIIGIVGFLQIRKSSGTQGGLILAILGILAALGFTVSVAATRINTYRLQEADRAAVIALVDAFGQDVLNSKPDSAWEKFSPAFHETFEVEAFRRTLNTLNAGNAVGKINEMRSNKLVVFETYSDSPDLFSQTMLYVQFQSKQDNSKFDDRYEIRLRKVPGVGWRIERLDAFFPPPKITAPKGGGDPNATMGAQGRAAPGNPQAR